MDTEHFLKREQRNQGKIGLGVYFRYLKAMKGLYYVLPVAFFLLTLTTLADSGFRYLVSIWVDGCKENLCRGDSFLALIRNFFYVSHSYSIALFFFSFCFFAILLRAINWILLIGFLTNGARNLHSQMVESFSHVRVTFFDENPTGRLIRRFSGDYSQIKDDIPNIFTDILSSVFDLIVISLFIIFQAPIASISVLPCGFLYYRIQRVFKPASREVQRYSKILETPMWSLFTETVVGYQTIRAYGKTKEFYDRLIHTSVDFGKASLLQSRFTRWLNLRLKFTSECFTLFVTLVVVYLVSQGKAGVGKAGFLMSLTIGLDATMQWLTRSLSLIETKMVSAERVIEYKNLPPEENLPHKIDADTFHKMTFEKGEVVFENFTASYRKHLPIILNNLSVTFDGHKKIGIIGRTGAGKSSLFQALFRMMYVHSGKILIDGTDIAQLPLEQARSLFAIVPQEPHLFSGTLKFNLDRTGKYSEQQMWDALNEVQLARYVNSLPGKLNYMLTERGGNFSVGQRQLLCMSRAILCDAKVVLMDEATASVDLETDTLIQQAIDKAFQNKTVIIIAHRLETLKRADKIIVLSHGKLLDSGNTEMILAKYSGSLREHMI